MLTQKQEEFCKAIVYDGLNYSDAYRRAYNTKKMSDKTVNEKACLLKNDGKIAARIEALRKRLESPKIISAMRRQEKLSRMIEESDDPGVVIKAVDLLNKMQGLYVQKVDASVTGDVNINIEMTDE